MWRQLFIVTTQVYYKCNEGEWYLLLDKYDCRTWGAAKDSPFKLNDNIGMFFSFQTVV